MARILHNTRLTELARELRKNATEEENRLWYQFLKTLPVHFSRQKVIGNYIVDFYCASAKLVIELDGSQHFEEMGEEYDKQRDAFLGSLGMKVIRYSNLELNRNFQGICEDIWNQLGLPR